MEDAFSSGQFLAYGVWCREGTLDLTQQEGNAHCPTLGEGHRQPTSRHQLHTHSLCAFICGNWGRNLRYEL